MSGLQLIEHHHTLDHVGDHGSERTILDVHRNDPGNFVTRKSTHRAIDSENARWTSESRRSQAQLACR